MQILQAWRAHSITEVERVKGIDYVNSARMSALWHMHIYYILFEHNMV